MIRYVFDFQRFTNYGLIRIRFGITYSLFFLCTRKLKLQRQRRCGEPSVGFGQRESLTCWYNHPHWWQEGQSEKNQKYNLKGRLKGGDVKQNFHNESYKKSYHNRTRHNRRQCTSSVFTDESVPNAEPKEEWLSLHGPQNLKDSQNKQHLFTLSWGERSLARFLSQERWPPFWNFAQPKIQNNETRNYSSEAAFAAERPDGRKC